MDSVAQGVEELKTYEWAVFYSKVSTDKGDGIELLGVFFGGVSDSEKGASAIAIDCVNNIKGGTIFPRVVRLSESNNLIDALYTSADHFENIVHKMQETELISGRAQEINKIRRKNK